MNNENTNKWIDKDILLGEVLPISEYITTHPFSILQKEYGIKYDDIKKDLNDEINDEKAQYFYDKFMEDGDLDIDDDGGYKLANSTNTKNNMGLAKKYKIPMRTIKLICEHHGLGIETTRDKAITMYKQLGETNDTLKDLEKQYDIKASTIVQYIKRNVKNIDDIVKQKLSLRSEYVSIEEYNKLLERVERLEKGVYNA